MSELYDVIVAVLERNPDLRYYQVCIMITFPYIFMIENYLFMDAKRLHVILSRYIRDLTWFVPSSS